MKLSMFFRHSVRFELVEKPWHEVSRLRSTRTDSSNLEAAA